MGEIIKSVCVCACVCVCVLCSRQPINSLVSRDRATYIQLGGLEEWGSAVSSLSSVLRSGAPEEIDIGAF